MKTKTFWVSKWKRKHFVRANENKTLTKLKIKFKIDLAGIWNSILTPQLNFDFGNRRGFEKQIGCHLWNKRTCTLSFVLGAILKCKLLSSTVISLATSPVNLQNWTVVALVAATVTIAIQNSCFATYSEMSD